MIWIVQRAAVALHLLNTLSLGILSLSFRDYVILTAKMKELIRFLIFKENCHAFAIPVC